ncbi:MAG: hypothetical protein H7Z40_15730 [Phycisphaerae bacterium]|nr:hypothetical protein [Gemmatimonadaceae bacterium]
MKPFETTRVSLTRVLVASAVLLAAPLGLNAQRTTPPNTNTKTPVNMSMQDGLTMEASDASLRLAMHAFITAAGEKNSQAAAGLISSKMKANAGADAVNSFLSQQIVPFFAGNKGLGNSTTISNTTDGFGQQGHAYYAYIRSADGELRPFVMYVVLEDGQPRVANVLVNKLVEGRHK